MLIETKYDKELRENIVSALEEVVGVPREYWEIKRTKERSELEIRQVYCYLLKTNTDLNLQHIATLIGYKDHTSVIRAVETVEQLYRTNYKTRKTIDLFKFIYGNRNTSFTEVPS